MRTLAALFLLTAASFAQEADGGVALLTDEAISRYLRRGQDLARSGQWPKVVDVLQRVIEGDPRIFPDLEAEVLHAAVHSRDGFLYYPARELCVQELAKMPPEGIDAYRSTYDNAARKIFKEAEATPNLSARIAMYASVYDLYLISSFGDDAMDRAASLNLELGRYYEALYLFGRILDLYPKDADVSIPMVLTKGAFCAARIGDKGARDRLLGRIESEFPRARILVEGKRIPVGDLAAHPAFEINRASLPTVDRPDDWPVRGGNAARSHAAEDIPESIARTPLWSYGLHERDLRLKAVLRYVLDEDGWRSVWDLWGVRKPNREKAPEPKLLQSLAIDPYPTVYPFVENGIVYYKDYKSAISRYVGSGWYAGLESSGNVSANSLDPSKLAKIGDSRPGVDSEDRGSRLENVYRYLDYGGNSVVVTRDRFIAVESRKPPDSLAARKRASSRGSNELMAYSRTTGKLEWAWNSELGSKEVWQDDARKQRWLQDYHTHARVVFRGPGVAAGGLLYTLVDVRDRLDKPAGVSIWAFDIQTGEVRFRTQLHRPDELLAQIPVDATLAVAGGAVYAVTSSGVVAAVDALPPGRIRWIRRYERSFQTGVVVPGRPKRRRGWPAQGRASAVVPSFALNNPVVTAGKVIVMSPDAAELLVLHAEDGRIAWRLKKKAMGSVAHIVGVNQGVLVLAGASVVGHSLDDGKLLWGPKSLNRTGDQPYGRGIVGTRYAYVPTRNPSGKGAAIHRFDILSGQAAEPMEFSVPRLGNLVYTGGRLFAAHATGIHCFSTIDHEIEAVSRRIEREGETAQLLFERALVKLSGDSSSILRGEARKDLAKALALPADNLLKSRLRSTAVENLLAIALAQSDLEAVDEAAAVAQAGVYQAQAAFTKAHVLNQLGRTKEAFAQLTKLALEHEGVRVKTSGAGVVEARDAAARIRDEMADQDPRMRAEFEQNVRDEIADAVKRGDMEHLRKLPDFYGRRHPCEEAYLAEARYWRQEGETEQANAALRRLVREFPSSIRRGEAHLLLALSLARKGLRDEAHQEYREALKRLDAGARPQHAAILKQLSTLLPDAVEEAPMPRITIPLGEAPFARPDAVPVSVGEPLPRALENATLYTEHGEWLALDRDGKPVWGPPAPPEIPMLGAPDNSATVTMAAVVAAHRFVAVDGDYLILADVYGAMRVNAKTGKRVWSHRETAVAPMFANLARDLAREEKSARPRPRRNSLPTYALKGGLFMTLHPQRGLIARNAKSGNLVWQRKGPKDSIPVGPPSISGGMVLAGWSYPGRVRVYGLDGKLLKEHMSGVDRRRGYLLSAPVLDLKGQLYIVNGDDDPDKPASSGGLRIVDAITGESDREDPHWVRSPTAAILHVEKGLVVYHDGGDGGKADRSNLHLIRPDGAVTTRFSVLDLMPAVHTIVDGSRLFVFTYQPGRSMTSGARLFRIDLGRHSYVGYQHPAPALAYSVPVMTQRYLVLSMVEPNRAEIICYDRDAAKEGAAPQPVFRGGGAREEARFRLLSRDRDRFHIAPGVALSGTGLIWSTPFGTVKLRAPGEER